MAVGEGHPLDGLDEVTPIYGLFPTASSVDLMKMLSSGFDPFCGL